MQLAAPGGDCLSSAHGSSGSGSSSSIETLIDHYLGPLYPDYADHTRPMLIRQARDLLVCTFHGDLERFEVDFLRPATDIVRVLWCAYQRGKFMETIGMAAPGCSGHSSKSAWVELDDSEIAFGRWLDE
uniref:Uncharacterized protein n=1 Tax=Anopheles culicifacies TaxID=139723 RepID=A0A182MNK0_9DIPT